MKRAALLAVLSVAVLLTSACDANSADQPAQKPSPASGVTAIARCLTERGWNPKVDEVLNSLEFSGTESQMAAYNADYADCETRFGEKQVSFSEFTPEMWKNLYLQETTTAECLRGQGIDVPQIPTFETFVQRYQSDAPWTSYGFIPHSSAEDERALNIACPQPEL